MARSKIPLFDRGSAEVFSSTGSWLELMEALTYVHLGGGEGIHVQVLGGNEPLAQVIREHSYLGAEELRSGKDFAVFSLSKNLMRGGRKTRVTGTFAVASLPDRPVHVVVCCSTPSFARLALTPFLENLYPRVVRPFLSQHELHGVVRTLQRAVQPDSLRVLESSARRRLASVKRKMESERRWTDLDPERAFREAKEQDIWFSSLRLEVARRDRGAESGRWLGVHCRISKYGAASCADGFQLVSSVVLPMLVQITADRVKQFSNRERLPAAEAELRPLELSYDRPLLSSPADLKRLLEALRKFPHGTCTVLHGNPYLHVTLVDDLDFSAADVWVLSRNNILIVPQLHASHGALKKLVNHIFEHFGEATIGEATA